jgi:hypothetical protein
MVVCGPVNANIPESLAAKAAGVYTGVWRTLRPDRNVRDWIGGSVQIGSCGRTRRKVDGGIRAGNKS